MSQAVLLRYTLYSVIYSAEDGHHKRQYQYAQVFSTCACASIQQWPHRRLYRGLQWGLLSGLGQDDHHGRWMQLSIQTDLSIRWYSAIACKAGGGTLGSCPDPVADVVSLCLRHRQGRTSLFGAATRDAIVGRCQKRTPAILGAVDMAKVPLAASTTVVKLKVEGIRSGGIRGGAAVHGGGGGRGRGPAACDLESWAAAAAVEAVGGGICWGWP